MNPVLLTDKQACCGCTACASICPPHAISMVSDELGFLFPQVDEAQCVDCGLCVQVCSFHANYDTTPNLPQPDTYAVRHKDSHEIASSQSGAAFVLLSDWVLDQGGVVYGAGYKDHFQVVHKRALNKEQRNELRGSKYVQSDLRGVFEQVRRDLKEGRTVCFSGTPCQVSGLSSFIGPHVSNRLFLLDLVCHGVPAPKIWKDYIAYLEAKEKKKITSVNFRDKKLKGWKSHIESFVFNNATIYTSVYTSVFYSHLSLRHSCSKCPYCNTKRPSDITIGDFWKIEEINETFASDNQGCSLVLVNTPKGRAWFEAIKRNADILPTRLQDSLHPQLCYPNPLHPQRDAFEQDYVRSGFKKTLRKWEFIGWRKAVKKYLGYPFRLTKRIIKQYTSSCVE